MPLVVSRWQMVLLKKFRPARYLKLAPEQGALARSRLIAIVPWSVVSVIGSVPVRASPLVGGRPTSVRSPPLAGVFQTQVAVVAVFCLLEKTPPTNSPTTTATTATRPTASPACSCRLRRAFCARRASCRSILARAILRCLVLLEATECSPSRGHGGVDRSRARARRRRTRPQECTGKSSVPGGPG